MKIVRIVILILLALGLGGSLLWLAAQPGKIVYEGAGTTIEVGLVAAALGLVLAVIVLFVAFRLFVWLWTLPARIKRATEEAARRRGLEALAAGYAALEGGEIAEARKQSQKALTQCSDVRAAKLLAAKAAMAAADIAGAERLYAELADMPGFLVAGRRGLAEAALARGADTTALAHADAALDGSKTAPWPAEFIFDRKVAAGDWDGALLALDSAEKRGQVGSKTAQRRRAVLLTASAQRAERTGDASKAQDLSQRATKLAPGFAPAAALAARVLNSAGKAWQAASVLEAAWEQSPHPALALAYRDLKADEPATARAKWLDGLIQMNSGHRESTILRVEQALALEDGAVALNHLTGLLAGGATTRTLGLQAAALTLTGDAKAAQDVLARMVSAPREADWSDLDPEGPAFAYDDADWVRLVESFGDGGTLIHPRHERFQPERLAAPELAPTALVATTPNEPAYVAPDADLGWRPDDPGTEPATDAEGAAIADQRPQFPLLR